MHGHKYALLVTFRSDGSAVPTPVWFALLDDRHLVTQTEERTAKVRRIRHNPRARVLPCDPRGKPLGPGVDAAVRTHSVQRRTRTRGSGSRSSLRPCPPRLRQAADRRGRHRLPRGRGGRMAGSPVGLTAAAEPRPACCVREVQHLGPSRPWAARDAAMRGEGDGQPLLRGGTVQTIAGIAVEEQVLVFAEPVRCLGHAARPHGVDAHVADGSIAGREFEALKLRFTAGEFPILCLSRVGQEGHNLQNASVLCHLDLPVAARRARAARRPRRPPRRRPRLGSDLHPLHPRRRHRPHRLDPLPARRRTPPGARLLRRRRRRRLHRRHPARADHRRDRRTQGPRRLRRDGREAARGGQRVRRGVPAGTSSSPLLHIAEAVG